MLSAMAVLALATGCAAKSSEPVAMYPGSPGLASRAVSPPLAALSGSRVRPPATRTSRLSDTRTVLLPPDAAGEQQVLWSLPPTEKVQGLRYWDRSRPEVQRMAPARRSTISGRAAQTNRVRYVATMVGLQDDWGYCYQIVTSSASSDEACFKTQPDSDDTWSFLAFGDTQVDNAGSFAETLSRALAAEPDARLLVSVGDLINRPNRGQEWTDLFRAAGGAATGRPWLSAVGNHEQCLLLAVPCDASGAAAFRYYFAAQLSRKGPLWYVVDHGGVRFVVLDSFGGHLRKQARFLKAALANNPGNWSVVVMHACPFGSRPGKPNPDIRAELLPIIEGSRADLVLCGHDHSYMRGYRRPGGPQYVTSVTGPLYLASTKADWVANGAVVVSQAWQTSTYQVITVSSTRLRYRAVVTATGAAPPPGVQVGEVLDSVDLSRR